MNSHDISDVVTVSTLFRVEATPGVASTLTPADPTAVTLRVRKPDGVIVVYVYLVGVDIVRDSLGAFHADLTPVLSGIWHYRWEGTGAAAGTQDGVFFVRPSRVVAG